MHIQDYCKSQGIVLLAVNGYVDHLHCLIDLQKDQNISMVAKLIKGESSFWINKNICVDKSFAWQNEYRAISVGEGQVNRLKLYIKSQAEHHQNKPISQKFDEA